VTIDEQLRILADPESERREFESMAFAILDEHQAMQAGSMVDALNTFEQMQSEMDTANGKIDYSSTR